MKEELSLLNPYSYSYDSHSETYQFTTKNNITYNVVFFKDYTLNAISDDYEFKNVYQIVIEKITDKLEPLDIRVSLTIDLIVATFFSKVENAIIYVCSSSDNKEISRVNTFNRWYDKSKNKSKIVKIDRVLKVESTILYTSLLYHNKNQEKNLLLDAFDKLNDALNSDTLK